MKTIHFTEGAVTMQPGWQEAQVVTLSGKLDDVATSVVITSRSAPEGSGDANALLNHRLDERSKATRRFQILRQPSIVARGGATCTSQLLHDEVGMVLINEAAFFVGGRLVSITTTGIAAGRESVEAEARRVVESLKFRA